MEVREAGVEGGDVVGVGVDDVDPGGGFVGNCAGGHGGILPPSIPPSQWGEAGSQAVDRFSPPRTPS